MNEKKDTIGKISSELAQKEPDSRDPIELEREMHSDYESNVIQCAEDGLESYNTDFFVVVVTKKEPLMPNVLRNYFFHRSTCPTPDYDQTVYRVIKNAHSIEFLWVIPSKDTCLTMKENALQVAQEEKELLKYVLDFADGTLFKLAQFYNQETKPSAART